MSYCRFQNTYQNLKDCVESIVDKGTFLYPVLDIKDLSESEKKYALKLRKLCEEYLELVKAEEEEENE